MIVSSLSTPNSDTLRVHTKACFLPVRFNAAEKQFGAFDNVSVQGIGDR